MLKCLTSSQPPLQEVLKALTQWDLLAARGLSRHWRTTLSPCVKNITINPLLLMQGSRSRGAASVEVPASADGSSGAGGSSSSGAAGGEVPMNAGGSSGAGGSSSSGVGVEVPMSAGGVPGGPRGHAAMAPHTLLSAFPSATNVTVYLDANRSVGQLGQGQAV